MRAWRTTAAMVALAALAACATRGEREAEGISRAALEAHVRFLASDALRGRLTGTPDYQIAAQYVESQFRQIGLAPAGTQGYFQDVPYASALIDTQRSRVRLHRNGRVQTLRWKDDWVAGGDVLRARTRVRAPAVFAGYGVSAPQLGHDDYAGLDVRGKIVVTLGGAPKRFPANERAYYSSGVVATAAAVKHGAVGLVSLRDAYDVKNYPWESTMRNAGTVPAMRWVSEDGRAADYFPEILGSVTLSERAAPALFAGAPHSHEALLALDAAGAALPRFALPVEIELERRSQVARTSSPNVIGLLRGSDPALADEFVVYTAHLDHVGVGAPVAGDAIYNGMYDNAMGVAMLIESARALARLAPKRSILFIATSGEERGLLGADYFAHLPTVPIAKIRANINLDMPLLLFPLREVVAFGAEHSTLGAQVEAAAQAEGLRLAPDPMPDEVIFIRSDQYPLVRKGIPAVFLTPGFGSADPAIEGGAAIHDFLKSHYHKPSDDLSRPVHWESAERFTRVNVHVGLAVANADTPPRWHPGNFFGELFGKPAGR